MLITQIAQSRMKVIKVFMVANPKASQPGTARSEN